MTYEEAAAERDAFWLGEPRSLRTVRPRLSLWQRFRVWLNNIEAQYQDGEG